MNGKPILIALAIIGGLAIFASLSRSFWFALIAGGPIFLGIVLVAVFMLGVFLGSRR
ncbi:MAG: hypothetical protein Q4B54_00850 [Coriobacteriales bacterium]|nr:hypothetical protein [Coriobacteriales bacterium]